MNAVEDFASLGRIAGLVREDGDALDLFRDSPAEGPPREETPSADPRASPGATGQRACASCPHEGRLQADDAVSGLAAASQRPRNPTQHRGQSGREIGLAEEFLGFEVDLRRGALDDGPDVGGEDGLRETSFADVLVRCRDRVSGLQGLIH